MRSLIPDVALSNGVAPQERWEYRRDRADLFAEALERTDPHERAAFLDQACQGDPALRQRIDRLLAQHEHAGAFLESPLHAAGTIEQLAPESAGTQIGPYKLIEPIGEGGMGTVWMAQQATPVKRLVAVKLIKTGMDSRQVLARFEAERQALALMDHPNIAKVLDAGTTQAEAHGLQPAGLGRPYFVMELVKGVPITTYCDENHLPVQARLELFTQVCHAVQHAHQKGVIHRDLKPSNVLVALYDDRPVPKVIDFGVAKAAGTPLTDRTMFTGFGQIVGTIEYMSPEQARLNALDIDTRGDVYSLGVLLYELLTGTTPFEKKRLREAAFDEMLRMIREDEPPKPSTRLSTAEGRASIAANRGLDPNKLCGLVRGDLDWIVTKALEKDRNRRYETANGLAMDVQRYLADEPVVAGPPSASYRLRKFARRNRGVLAAAGAFVLLLMTAVVTLSVALVAVDRERQQKESALEAEGKRRQQTRAALDAMSSEIIEEWLARQAVLLPQHKKFLAQALRDYEEFAADTGQQEESRSGVAGAHARVGHIRGLLGEQKEAQAAWQRARGLYAALVADFPGNPVYRRGLARAHLNLGILYKIAERAQEAQAEYDQCLAIGRSLVAEFPDVPAYRLSLAQSLGQQGVLHKNLNQPKEAEEVYREAISLLKRLVSDDVQDPDYRDMLGGTLGNLGVLLDRAGRSPEADPGRSREAADAFAAAVDIFQQLVADSPAEPRYLEFLAMHQDHLAGTHRDAGRYLEAEPIFLQALKTREQLVAQYRGKPVYREGLAITLNNYAILLKNTERAAEAEKLYGESLAMHKQLAADFPEIPGYQNRVAAASVNLARLLLARNDALAARALLADAEPHVQAALAANRLKRDYRNNYRLLRWRLAETLLALKDHSGAAKAATEFLQAEVEPPRDAYTAAGLLAGCVRLATEDEQLTVENRHELSVAYGEQAVSALRQAIDKGAKEVSQMPEDPNLDPLRSRRDFQKLLVR